MKKGVLLCIPLIVLLCLSGCDSQSGTVTRAINGKIFSVKGDNGLYTIKLDDGMTISNILDKNILNVPRNVTVSLTLYNNGRVLDEGDSWGIKDYTVSSNNSNGNLITRTTGRITNVTGENPYTMHLSDGMNISNIIDRDILSIPGNVNMSMTLYSYSVQEGWRIKDYVEMKR